MKVATAGITLALFTTSLCSALPPTKKDRVHDLPLSEKEHTINGEHNDEYDHDAFLGKDEAEDFDQLSPEESKERLGKLVDKIDKDGDGFVTEEELKQWIQYVQRKYITDDTERMWAEHDLDGDKLTWESYRKRIYSYDHDPDEDESFKDLINKDKRKFDAADTDKDGRLSKEEYAAFLHPEEMDHMKDIVVLETIEDIDKDKDGFISLEEYIDLLNMSSYGDTFSHQDQSNKQYFDLSSSHLQMIYTGDMWPNKESEEPDWVKTEREQFGKYRDANGDGKMDSEEVKSWILPDNYDHSEAEAKHLLHESDVNEVLPGSSKSRSTQVASLIERTAQDGKLTKEEILEKYDIFVGSQATEFGEALTRHDEF